MLSVARIEPIWQLQEVRRAELHGINISRDLARSLIQLDARFNSCFDRFVGTTFGIRSAK